MQYKNTYTCINIYYREKETNPLNDKIKRIVNFFLTIESGMKII